MIYVVHVNYVVRSEKKSKGGVEGSGKSEHHLNGFEKTSDFTSLIFMYLIALFVFASIIFY